MNILGINWEQNSTAALWVDGTFKGVVSEERFSRTKNDERYPKNAIDWLLKKNGLAGKDLHKVLFVSTMWTPGYILSRHYTSFSVKDYVDEQHKIWKPRLLEGRHISQIEVYKERLDLEQYPGPVFWESVVESMEGDSGHVSSESSKMLGYIRRDVVCKHLGVKKEVVDFVDHASSHAAYAFHTSPRRFSKDSSTLVLTLDAFGDNVNYSASEYSVNEGRLSKRVVCNGNTFIVGRLYRYITLILGLKRNEHEYKVMGLAPYCKEIYSERLFNLFKTFQKVHGLDFVYDQKPSDMYFSVRDMLEGERFDSICGALQRYTEFLISTWVNNLVQATGIHNVVLAGGVGMNVKANMIIAKLPGIDSLYIPPSPDDSSQAMGAILSYLDSPKGLVAQDFSPYLGRDANKDYSQNQLLELLSKYENLNGCEIIPFSNTQAARLLSEGKVLGRCCGKEEFGARALGNRSILADPRSSHIKKIINEKIKNRDFWMPFACSVLEEYHDEYFVLDSSIDSYRFMTLCCETKPKGEASLSAALHPYDMTCRPQLVGRSINPSYYELIEAFARVTGISGLLNTSLNLHGEPIASTVKDAIHVLGNSGLDGLILNDFMILKRHAGSAS